MCVITSHTWVWDQGLRFWVHLRDETHRGARAPALVHWRKNGESEDVKEISYYVGASRSFPNVSDLFAPEAYRVEELSPNNLHILAAGEHPSGMRYKTKEWEELGEYSGHGRNIWVTGKPCVNKR